MGWCCINVEEEEAGTARSSDALRQRPYSPGFVHKVLIKTQCLITAKGTAPRLETGTRSTACGLLLSIPNYCNFAHFFHAEARKTILTLHKLKRCAHQLRDPDPHGPFSINSVRLGWLWKQVFLLCNSLCPARAAGRCHRLTAGCWHWEAATPDPLLGRHSTLLPLPGQPPLCPAHSRPPAVRAAPPWAKPGGKATALQALWLSYCVWKLRIGKTARNKTTYSSFLARSLGVKMAVLLFLLLNNRVLGMWEILIFMMP